MPEALKPYVNRKNISFIYSSPELKRTLTPALVDEIKEGYLMLKPVYRFLMGLS